MRSLFHRSAPAPDPAPPPAAPAPEYRPLAWFRPGVQRTLRNRYRLPRRVSPAALLFVPWIDVLLVVGAACLFHSATCGVPAETFRLDGAEVPSVSLPDAPFASAARSSLVLVVRRLPPDALAGAPLAPECLPAQAFLDNVAWNLSRPDRAAAFPEAVAAAAKAVAERSALVYMDADLSHRDALRLAAMLRAPSGSAPIRFSILPSRLSSPASARFFSPTLIPFGTDGYLPGLAALPEPDAAIDARIAK